MKRMRAGTYFGEKFREFNAQGITVSETDTSLQQVPWHYHENPYFTYFIEGHLLDINKKEELLCKPGALIFHNWEEPHRNKGSRVHALHLEINQDWMKAYSLKLEDMQGSMLITNPVFKILFDRIHKEIILNDNASAICIEGLVLLVLGEVTRNKYEFSNSIPSWVNKAKEYIYYNCSENLQLQKVALEINLHPAYLCQAFAKYMNYSFAEYIRLARIEKATSLLTTSVKSLAEITYECGFSDQSHFTRLFKKTHGITPLKFRKSIAGINSIPKARMRSIF